jgi:SagB-type dehydrogenase family enzyme
LSAPKGTGRRIPLSRPDTTALTASGVSLTELLEADHACPVSLAEELSVEQIGELLYRSARIRSVGPACLPAGAAYQVSQRPYFNTGCLYELELYLCAHRCTGLAPATYHYDPGEHALTVVSDAQDEVRSLLDLAMVAASLQDRPPAMICVTTRIARVSWLFGDSAYAMSLLHFGALQQTLYLCAKAMGLAVHAVPLDTADQVDWALRLPWPAEVGIGECVLGLSR